MVGVAPLMRSSFPGIGPPLLRMVQFFGADAALTEIRGAIAGRRTGRRWSRRWSSISSPADRRMGRLPLGPASASPWYIYDTPAAALRLPCLRISEHAGLYRRVAGKLGGFCAYVYIVQHAQESFARSYEISSNAMA